MLWRAQFLLLLRGYNLLGYIDGSYPAPPRFRMTNASTTSTESATSIPNPEFKLWDHQDQLILSWIISSLTEEVISHITSSSTSYEAWKILARTFAPSSRTRVMHLKDTLSQVKRDTSSIADYLQLIRSLTDSLAAIDRPVSDKDLVLATLRGVGTDYRDFATFVHTRAKPVSFDNLCGMLLSHEAYLADITDQIPLQIQTTNAASHTPTDQANSSRPHNNANRNY
ncbi:hypothetical protein L1049_021637 [Liquidambar formosana]|uniref:Gag protein n=1 Tax=Liquidambar formosana TaxID=63359 RepID=A0AAP0N6Q1_LIQFO